MVVGCAPSLLLVSLLRPTLLKEAWMFLLLHPCGLAFEATSSKTNRALDDIRNDTYPAFVIRKILEQMPIGWCLIRKRKWLYFTNLT